MQPVYPPSDLGYYAPNATLQPLYWGWFGPPDGTHTTGTASRAYPGGQKSN
jgi:hypothetical protein